MAMRHLRDQAKALPLAPPRLLDVTGFCCIIGGAALFVGVSLALVLVGVVAVVVARSPEGGRDDRLDSRGAEGPGPGRVPGVYRDPRH